MTNAKKAPAEPVMEAPPVEVPQVIPRPGLGMGHPEYHFVQGLMEVQKTLVEVNANVNHLTKSVDSLKSKVEDLTRVKNLVFGGAIALGAVVSVMVVVVKLAADYFTFKMPAPTVPAPPVIQAEPIKEAPQGVLKRSGSGKHQP